MIGRPTWNPTSVAAIVGFPIPSDAIVDDADEGKVIGSIRLEVEIGIGGGVEKARRKGTAGKRARRTGSNCCE